ncbi:SusC/RagA family TonB-linked outer membrane protein [Arthrospiribacter ruber]|nr:TonB-dependent receptor [Arthrospiribacter ruber]
MENKYKKCLLLVLGGMLSVTIAFAQKTVTGTITDEQGEGIPGVTVLIKNTSIGSASDIDGRYSISIPDGSNVLVFSFIGYNSQERAVDNQSVIDVVLLEDITNLTEMVVTGYAVQEKRDITGSVSQIKSEQLMEMPVATVENQLQGRLSGVNVTSSGQPGAPSTVRIRGFSSFQANEPLYVVDGVQTTDISSLNPNDVESISVLKDAGAASIYGSRASNGVILVTTKKGRKGELQISYNAFYGVQNPGQGFNNLLDTQGMADLQWLVFENGTSNTENHPLYGTWNRGGSGPRIPDYILPAGAMEGDPGTDPSLYNFDPDNYSNINQIVRANQVGTNWFREVTRNAPIQNHDISLAGGGEKSRFLVGLNYFNQDGIVIESFNRRYSARLNSEFEISNRVRIGQNLQVSYRENRGLVAGNQAEGNAIAQGFRMQPIVPVRDIMGNFAGTRAPSTGNGSNPVARQGRSRFNQDLNTRILGNIYVEADLTDNLSFRSSAGGTYTNGYFYNFTNRTYENGQNVEANSFTEGAMFMSDWTFTNTLTYSKTFDKHRITAVAGYESLKFDIGRTVSGNRGDYFSEDPDFRTLDNGAQIINASSNALTPTTGISYFLRSDYAYNDKYLLSFTVRRDGSSRFRDQFGTFPSVTGAWRLSEEGFLLNSGFLSDLKVRGGYGVMGNQQSLSPINQFFLFGGSPNTSFYDISGSNTSSVQGFRPFRIGNPDARWERAVNANVGIDASFFEDRLILVLDWYRRENLDLLYNPPLPGLAGGADVPFLNVGRMLNTGIDAELTYRNNFRNGLRFETNITLTTFRNEILNLADGVNEFFAGDSRIGNISINRVGNPMSAFFGYQVEGIFQSQEEVNSAPTQAFAAPGRFRFADVNGDGVIGPDDRVVLGSPIPDFTAGINLSLGYQNWDFSTFLFASVGNDIYNFTKWYTDFWPSFQGAKSIDLLQNSWTPENPGATTPMAENVSNFSTNAQSSSYYVEDGSFLRVRQMQVGYTFPGHALERLKLSRLRLYVQGTNLFTITGYSGLDPELIGGDTAFGIDYGNYPNVRQFLVGLNVGF